MLYNISGSSSSQSLWSAKVKKLENAFIKKKMTECTAIQPQLYRSKAAHVSVKTVESTGDTSDINSFESIMLSVAGNENLNHEKYVYDISEFVTTSELDTRSKEVESYRIGERQVFSLQMSGDRTFEISLAPPPKGPLDSTTFKNVVGKAFMLLEKRNEIISELKPKGSQWVDGNARMDLKYDPVTKSFDKKDFLNTLKEDIIKAMTPPNASDEEMEKIREKIEQAIMEMEDYFYELMDKTM